MNKLLKYFGITRITAGVYLTIVSVIYFLIGMFDVFVYKFIMVEILQILYIVALALPLLFQPIGRKIGLR